MSRATTVRLSHFLKSVSVVENVGATASLSRHCVTHCARSSPISSARNAGSGNARSGECSSNRGKRQAHSTWPIPPPSFNERVMHINQAATYGQRSIVVQTDPSIHRSPPSQDIASFCRHPVSDELPRGQSVGKRPVSVPAWNSAVFRTPCISMRRRISAA